MAVKALNAATMIDDDAVAAIAVGGFDGLVLLFSFDGIAFAVTGAQDLAIGSGENIDASVHFGAAAQGEVGTFMAFIGFGIAHEIFVAVFGRVGIDVIDGPAILAERATDREGKFRAILGVCRAIAQNGKKHYKNKDLKHFWAHGAL